MLEKIYQFLDEAETYYLATVEGDQPRVRPFGTILLFEEKLYIQTGTKKEVAKQIEQNNKVEICAFKDGSWLRLKGTLVKDDRRVIKEKMLEKMPSLREMYNEDDGSMLMLYFEKGDATISSFTKPVEVIIF